MWQQVKHLRVTVLGVMPLRLLVGPADWRGDTNPDQTTVTVASVELAASPVLQYKRDTT